MNEITNSYLVSIDKVLDNWAERIEKGDWEVDKHGVKGGIERFREADIGFRRLGVVQF